MDIVGLSGLITPSLDEMVFVAREMERRGMKLPLLIGGATTSKQHTAVKIAPEYSGPVVHVLDASRAVDVVSSLLGGRREAFERETRAAQAETREKYAGRKEKPLLSYEKARANRLRIDWDAHEIASPWFIGRRYLDDVPLGDVAKYIDWTFFFSAWELKGRYPAHPRRIRSTARRPRSCSSTPRRCWPASSTRSCSPPAASTASGRPTPRGTTSWSTGTIRGGPS